jgi:hypothetical protein
MSVASAQEINNGKPAQSATPALPPVINIRPGVAPGSEQWKQKKKAQSTWADGEHCQRDDADSHGLPARSGKGDRAAVIIAPGRGVLFLGTDAHEVAEWLAALRAA